MIRRALVLFGVILAVTLLPNTAWAATTDPTPTDTATTTATPTPTDTTTPTATSTTPTSVTVTGPVELDGDQFAVFAAGLGLVIALAAGSFVVGMRR